MRYVVNDKWALVAKLLIPDSLVKVYVLTNLDGVIRIITSERYLANQNKTILNYNIVCKVDKDDRTNLSFETIDYVDIDKITRQLKSGVIAKFMSMGLSKKRAIERAVNDWLKGACGEVLKSEAIGFINTYYLKMGYKVNIYDILFYQVPVYDKGF